MQVVYITERPFNSLSQDEKIIEHYMCITSQSEGHNCFARFNDPTIYVKF